MDENYLIRLEEIYDYDEVENVVRESFFNIYRPGCYEHYLLHILRNDKSFVKNLDFVILKDGKIIGQNVFVKTVIVTDDNKNIEVLTMGPICILPSYQRQGYGKILLDYSLEKAIGYGFGAVLFEGNIMFYGKSGFDYAKKFNIRYNDLDINENTDFFLCKELKTGFLKNVNGKYITPAIYYVDKNDVEEFDKKFPEKKKLKLPGQMFE